MKRTLLNPNSPRSADSRKEGPGFLRLLVCVAGVAALTGCSSVVEPMKRVLKEATAPVMAQAEEKAAASASDAPVVADATVAKPLPGKTTVLPPVEGLDAGFVLNAADSAFLDEVQRRAVLYFVEQSDPVTGLTRDRAPNNGTFSKSPSSAAATGFALTAWCIADQRGWMGPGEARRRTVQALRSVADVHAHEHGWLYHFVSATDGKRMWRSEASTIDTALFLQGALTAREYLRDPEVTELVNQIYARIDWKWALNDGVTLSHGWKPETGFIPHRWDNYAEMMGLYLLGIGATNNPLPVETWSAWQRGPIVGPEGRTFIQGGSLFTHQYAQAWFDFRGKRDAYADYWQNSVEATLAQREWSATQSVRFPLWSKELWGVSASDSARGYMPWGIPLKHSSEYYDGTLVPCAPGGSLPFAPRECLTALKKMREVGGEALWGRYGFADAFNPQTGWVGPDVIGIDVGITLVMAENLRSGLVWNIFMRAPEVQRGMKLAGFKDTTLALPVQVAMMLR
jgi:hypothetical protein